MSIKEITNKVNSLGNAWESFKDVNDARLREVERKGSADPLYMEQLSKINSVLDNQKSRMNQLETAAMRPEKEVTYASKSENPSQYTKAFNSYLRKGETSHLEGAEIKALSVGSATDGGYLVTPKLSESIAKIVFESSPMRQIAGVEQISTDSLDIIVDNGSMGAGWTTETASVSDTATAQIHKETIPTFELYAQPKATQKLDKLLNTSLKEFEKALNLKIQTAQASFEKELGAQVAVIVNEVTSTLGNGSLANGVNAGIASVARGLINGQGVDARDVANSVARSLAPDVEDFFRQSSSQIAGDLSSFIGLGSRNN